MGDTLVIFRKELREILRDRKTLVFMLALPMLLMPLLADLGFSFAINSLKKAGAEKLQYAIFDAEHLPELARAFAGDGDFELVDTVGPEAIKAAIGDGTIDFALEIRRPSDATGVGSQTTVMLHYDDSSTTSTARQRASRIIERVSDERRTRRLESIGVPAEQQGGLLTPVVIVDVDVAEARAHMGEIVGKFLPYIFIVFCFLGALYPAIDLGAGEKERGTLETLLLVPVPRRHIVLGKYFVIFTAAATAAVLSLTSLGVWLAIRGEHFMNQVARDAGDALAQAILTIIKSIGAVDLILIAVMLIPTAAMFAALLLSVSIYAKSFKEAQSYAAPLNFLVVIPAFLPMLPGVELNWRWAMVPITNIALAVKELIKGTMNYEMLGAILGSSVVIAGLLLVFCSWWFRRESVLFRQ